MENLESVAKKQKPRLSLGVGIIMASLTFMVGTYLGYSNSQSIRELNNLRTYAVPQGRIEHPYNIHVINKTSEQGVHTYLVNSKTDEKYEIFHNMRVGTMGDRFKAIFGNTKDPESLIGKPFELKRSISDKLFDNYNNKEDEH